MKPLLILKNNRLVSTVLTTFLVIGLRRKLQIKIGRIKAASNSKVPTIITNMQKI